MKRQSLGLIALMLWAGCDSHDAHNAHSEQSTAESAGSPSASLEHPKEIHLTDIRQLTFGGENAEAYWSSDGAKLILQSTREGYDCDQIFTMSADGSNVKLVSTGRGRTTCSYFMPDGKHILYASTHLASAACPPPPDYSKGYIWKLYPEFDVFLADADGQHLQRLTTHDNYDAEATVSTDGQRIIFTSVREGDIDLYTMRADGSDVQRITHELGYDGGGFFSADGKKIVWRASRPQTPEEINEYKELLEDHSVRPRKLEIFVADADGGNVQQVTQNGAANFCPFFFPDGERIIFASNMADSLGRNFDLWMVNVDGSGLQQVTFDPSFDAFPMFSPDGRYLAFSSNRNSKTQGDTNVFVAEWAVKP